LYILFNRKVAIFTLVIVAVVVLVPVH